ncbi:MAG: DUF5689 domain-containing protein [Bacteroidota bacterium]
MKITSLKYLFLFVLLGALASSCIDQEFDVPPLEQEKFTFETNSSIADLKNTFDPDGAEFQMIESEIIIEGIVTADDASGNFFKRIVIQDESAGIEILINAIGLNNLYPIGRRLRVNCQGLLMTNGTGTLQLGGDTFDSNGDLRLGGIDEVSLDVFIEAGARGIEVEPTVVAIDELGENNISQLVKLEDVQFAQTDTDVTYADVQSSKNLTLEDCKGNTIVLRSSSFADFADEFTPTGKGSITGIYNVFLGTQQIFLRDTRDVALEEDRCSVDVEVGNLISFDDLKARYTEGGDDFQQVNEDVAVEGVVVANDEGGNFFKHMYIQNENGQGLRVNLNVTDIEDRFPVGTKVAVNANGFYLGLIQGQLQLGDTFTSNGELRLGGINDSDIPKAVAILERDAAIETITLTIPNVSDELISALVTIENVQFGNASVGATLADVSNNFARNLNIQDCDGNSIILRTSNFADFAEFRAPDTKGSLTGILSAFNGDYQLFIRNTDDIQFDAMRCDVDDNGGGGGMDETDPVDNLSLDFEAATNNVDIAIEGWMNVAKVGSRVWRGKSFGGSTFAQSTAFNDNAAEMESWLITPPINADDPRTLSFETSHAFLVNGHEPFTLLISTDFDGENIDAATWTTLEATIADETTANETWVASGDIDLSAFSGVAYIAFRYQGSGPNGQTTSYRVDNIVVK